MSNKKLFSPSKNNIHSCNDSWIILGKPDVIRERIKTALLGSSTTFSPTQQRRDQLGKRLGSITVIAFPSYRRLGLDVTNLERKNLKSIANYVNRSWYLKIIRFLVKSKPKITKKRLKNICIKIQILCSIFCRMTFYCVAHYRKGVWKKWRAPKTEDTPRIVLTLVNAFDSFVFSKLEYKLHGKANNYHVYILTWTQKYIRHFFLSVSPQSYLFLKLLIFA